jgi:hypothetical protein
MKRIIGFWILCLAVVFLRPCAMSQDLQGLAESGSLPQRPANGVLDEAGMFERDPQRLQAISERLQEFERVYGFRICFAVYNVLLHDNPTERAGALQRSWLGNSDGLVIVYEADSKRLGYGRDMESANTRADTGESATSAIPLYILTPLLGRVHEKLAGCPEQGPAFVERLTNELTAELEAYFQRGQIEQPKGRVFRLVLLLVGAACVAALLGFLVSRLMDRAGAKRKMVFRFPDVAVGMRLGAPYGGGKISSQSFGGESRPG